MLIPQVEPLFGALSSRFRVALLAMHTEYFMSGIHFVYMYVCVEEQRGREAENLRLPLFNNFPFPHTMFTAKIRDISTRRCCCCCYKLLYNL